LVATFEDALRLYDHEPGSLVRDNLGYLLERTAGRISSLSQLIRYAAIVAIEEGYERVDRDLMDTFEIDWVAQQSYERVSQITRGATA
jgi:hypothetical protein